MKDISIKKQNIREVYIKKRNSITDKNKKSKIICSKLIELEEYKKSKIIAIYKSLKTEVDTDILIEESLKLGKTVALPRVEENMLNFYKINSIDETLEKSKFNIYEPIKNDKNYISIESIDLIIVPGICFDKQKNRLGFGKGFYDRVLQNENLKNIAICFESQILKNELLPVATFDIKVQKIITEATIYL